MSAVQRASGLVVPGLPDGVDPEREESLWNGIFHCDHPRSYLNGMFQAGASAVEIYAVCRKCNAVFKSKSFDPFAEVSLHEREWQRAHRDVLAKLCVKLLRGEAGFAKADGDPDLPERAERRLRSTEATNQLRAMIEVLGHDPDQP